jgi:hypothetical protein
MKAGSECQARSPLPGSHNFGHTARILSENVNCRKKLKHASVNRKKRNDGVSSGLSFVLGTDFLYAIWNFNVRPSQKKVACTGARFFCL